LLPGNQGDNITGIHGIGVRMPKAVAVAAATVGLAIELHMIKEGILIIGLLSVIFAAGIILVTPDCGITINGIGDWPKLHCKIAPAHTNKPIYFTSCYIIIAFNYWQLQ
jgi:hypothetical protein